MNTETEKEKGLHRILKVLTDYTAGRWAEIKMQGIAKHCSKIKRHVNDYLLENYTTDGLLVNAIKNANAEFINEYGEMCAVYSGFIKAGSTFAIDRRDKVVYFLSQWDKENAKCHIHYNPLDVDVIEMGTNGERFFSEYESGRFDISNSDVMLCALLDDIISGKINT